MIADQRYKLSRTHVTDSGNASFTQSHKQPLRFRLRILNSASSNIVRTTPPHTVKYLRTTPMLQPSRSGQLTLKHFSFLSTYHPFRSPPAMTHRRYQPSLESKAPSQLLHKTSHGQLDIVVYGNFNRHHPMWSSNHIAPRFIEDASDLIDFSQIHSLYRRIPQGRAIYWALNNPEQNSTIDQTATDSPDLLFKLHL